MSKKKTAQLRFSHQKEDLCSASVSQLITGAVNINRTDSIFISQVNLIIRVISCTAVVSIMIIFHRLKQNKYKVCFSQTAWTWLGVV